MIGINVTKFLSGGCEHPVVVALSSGDTGPSVLNRDCDTAWSAPAGETGSNALLILDLRCSTKINTISFKNLINGNGIKKFSILLSAAEDGPWTPLINGTLEPESGLVISISFNVNIFTK